MEAFRLEGVCFEYKDFEGKPIEAVKDVSFAVEAGQFVALLGANGSGKSTLAKLLNNLYEPSKGRVFIFGMDTGNEANFAEVKKSVGMVFQNPDNQMVASIVEDDIAFGPENVGVPREEIIERVEWALKAVDMYSYKTAAPFRMSGGQKQRIAIAGILALKPKIMIFDESTSMLDPKGRAEVMTVAFELCKKEGITVLFITHDMNEAIEADRVIVMNDGGICLDGTPLEVFSNPLLTEYKLKAPLIFGMAARLRALGVPISRDAVTEEHLTEELCRLL